MRNLDEEPWEVRREFDARVKRAGDRADDLGVLAELARDLAEWSDLPRVQRLALGSAGDRIAEAPAEYQGRAQNSNF